MLLSFSGHQGQYTGHQGQFENFIQLLFKFEVSNNV
jgi:hypothetical protein